MTLAIAEIRTTGRAAQMPVVMNVRALVPAEVEAHSAREAGTKMPPLRRLSSRHRQLARLIARGRGTSEAAMMVGLTASRVSVLKSDPTFKDLVQHYAEEADERYQTYLEQLEGLSQDAIEELRDRMENEPESFENDELRHLVQMLSDRTGYAPKRVEEKNINVNIGAKLDAARARALEANVIEGELASTSQEESVS